MKKLTSNLLSLFWTQFFGALNDNLFKSALVIMITYKSVTMFGLSPAAMVAFCGGIFILPFFLFSATSGQLADKYDKAWLTYRIKEAEVAIAVLGVLGIFLENYYLMVFVLFLLGLQSTFFGPLKYSLIPRYAANENLIFANAMVSSGTFVAILLGTILGGVAASGSGISWALVVLLMFFSLIGLYYARKLPLEKTNEEVKTENIKVDWNFLRSTKDILKLSFRYKKVFALIVGLSWFWFLGAGLLSLLPTLAKDIFNGTEEVATLMLFTFTLGMGIGPFVLEKATKGQAKKWIIPVSLMLMTAMIFDLGMVIGTLDDARFLLSLGESVAVADFFKLPSSIRICIDLFLLSFFGGMFTVPQFAELQRQTPPQELSRIVASNNIVNSFTMVTVSVMLMALHQMSFSLSHIFYVFAGLNSLMCVYLLYVYKEDFNRIWKF